MDKGKNTNKDKKKRANINKSAVIPNKKAVSKAKPKQLGKKKQTERKNSGASKKKNNVEDLIYIIND